MNNIIFLNGSLLPRSQASISVLDYGFLYGYGLFETMRAYNGQVFRLERHLERLSDSIEMLGFNIAGVDLRSAVTDVTQANNLSDARIRVTVSIGEGGMVPDPGSCDEPTVLVMAEAYQPYPPPIYHKGFKTITSTIRRNSQSPLSQIKSSCYLESLLARQQARAAGADEAILLNDKGFLTEASTSNIFLVTGSLLRTPARDSGILPGITREAILELAPQSGITSVEDNIEPDELFQAEEAFLTNSIMEIMPLTEVDGKPIGMGVSGQTTGKLVAAYSDLVKLETGKH
ncbi:MAG: aminotransferase class IV [Dehalococcoidales bacterium]|nr:MAG: aminotransferase class IV [Dehalococcoidales bacterium]